MQKSWVNCARPFIVALAVAHMNIHREQMRGMFLTGGREETTSIVCPKAAVTEDSKTVGAIILPLLSALFARGVGVWKTVLHHAYTEMDSLC